MPMMTGGLELRAATVLTIIAATTAVRAENAPASQPFLQAKTIFQTNHDYDPRLAIAVDAVVVHQHGAGSEQLARSIASWKRHGFLPPRRTGRNGGSSSSRRKRRG